MTTIKVGTRGSALALTQTNFVIGLLKRKFPGIAFKITVIKTTGDKITDRPLPRIDAKGLFIKEIEEALIKKKIDLAVHSLKDLPTELPKGLRVGAVLKREDARDCMVSLREWNLKTLPKNAVVGTSSLRRQAQILASRPDVNVKDLRGNLDTRIGKLKAGAYDAVIVAKAGLIRLRKHLTLDKMSIREIPYSQMLPAVGQGALAVEIREKEPVLKKILKKVSDPSAEIGSRCEREFLKMMGGGCQIPAGALATLKGKKLELEGLIASIDGKKIVRSKISGRIEDAQSLGRALAKTLLKNGGAKILAEIRN